MEYAIEHNRTRYFGDGTAWLVLNVFNPAAAKYMFKPAPHVTQLPLNKTEIALLQKDATTAYVDQSPAAMQRINQEIAKSDWKAQLTSELTSPTDFVFVTGEFRWAWKNRDLMLVHDFIGQDGGVGIRGVTFRPIQFYVTFAPTPKIRNLRRISVEN